MRLDSGRIEIANTGGSLFIGAGANDDFSDNENIFIGDSTGYSNTEGEANIFTGYKAGYSNTLGGFNVFTGYQAGHSNTTGNDNIFTDYKAGYSNTTGEKNIFLGYKAGYYETDSNKLYIANSSTTTPLIYGDFEADSLQVNGKLNINGVFNFPTTDGTAYQVLTTDGNGCVSWMDNTDDQALTLSNDSIILIHIQNLHYLKVYFSLLVVIFINRNSGYAFKKCLD